MWSVDVLRGRCSYVKGPYLLLLMTAGLCMGNLCRPEEYSQSYVGRCALHALICSSTNTSVSKQSGLLEMCGSGAIMMDARTSLFSIAA